MQTIRNEMNKIGQFDKQTTYKKEHNVTKSLMHQKFTQYKDKKKHIDTNT